MSKKSELLRIKGYAHNLKVVLRVFYWAMIIFTGVSLLAAIIIQILPESRFILKSNGMFSLDGIIQYDFSKIAAEGLSMKKIYFTIALMAIGIFAVLIPVFKQLVLILKTVEENKPFDIKNSKRITWFGVILILCSFVNPAIEVFVAKTILDTLKVQEISTNYSFDLFLLFTGFLLLILGGVFKYGSFLQHEYDETV
ncbi:MAG TPA: DUF2975 domain-containing protein [Mobilitalea sp.]|nr:DUF2975 domain-containing protein [Mobilitalea sp.]